ncbi:MAG: hypothetical protein ACXVW0_07615 [Nocardioides sp.]
MADNSLQTGSDSIATDDVTTLNGAASSGVKVPRSKVGFGDDGSYRDASSAFPLPVVQSWGSAGRTSKAIVAAFTSTAAAETAISFQVSSAGGALSAAAASYTVTTGKTLRLQTLHATLRAGGTTPAASLGTLKMKVGGNQQLQALLVAAPTSATASPAAFVGTPLHFPDGLDLPGGSVLSFTLTLSAYTALTNTPIIDLSAVGFEY